MKMSIDEIYEYEIYLIKSINVYKNGEGRGK